MHFLGRAESGVRWSDGEGTSFLSEVRGRNSCEGESPPYIPDKGKNQQHTPLIDSTDRNQLLKEEWAV